MPPMGKKCRVARHKKAKGKKAGPKHKTKVKVVKPLAKAGLGKKKQKVHRAKKSKAKVRVAKKGACGVKADAGPAAI